MVKLKMVDFMKQLLDIQLFMIYFSSTILPTL